MALFKARARALDMLGRQQIAGIPTAINELFKNAHDAYARRVTADFYRPEDLFVLRDDGLGMTEADFLERWLTLGTESKLGSAHGIAPPPNDASQSKRAVMGEKGIGRLAIASLGPQVLVLTRAKRGDQLGDLVAAFINWEMFENPGIDLDEVDIPVRTYPGGALPTARDVQALVNGVRKNLKKLQSRMDPNAALKILHHLDSFAVDPSRFFAKDFTLAGDGAGTSFFIQPVDETLDNELDGDDPKQASPLVKTLIGFSNTLSSRNKVDFVPEFHDHRSADDVVEVIGTSEFFTPEDFDGADHRIVGKFDKFGKFTGTVAVYRDSPKPYELPWSGSLGKAAACGPFSFRFAYVQGELKSTRLPPEEHARLTGKLDRIGGLYIFRDGIRVLPYGNSDVDFLDIERRRSQNAAHYFFSYRRMFGAIEIARSTNPELQEKAGREGFRANKAYRHFKAILESFLVQLAADFFRQGGPSAKAWARTRDELKQSAAARKEREQQAEAIRDAFQAQLVDVLGRLDARSPQRQVKELVRETKDALSRAAQLRDRAAEAVLEVEASAKQKLEALRASYVVKRPPGYALPRRLTEDWNAYQEIFEAFEQKVFAPGLKDLEDITAEAVRSARLNLSRRKRAERALGDGIRAARASVKPVADEATECGAAIQARTADLVRQALGRLESVIGESLENFAKIEDANDAAASDKQRASIIQTIESAAKAEVGHLELVREQLRVALRAGNGAVLTAAMEEELLALRDQAELDLGLTQLGMAVEIINHEFGASIRGVRTALRRLKPWADRNADLKMVYSALRTSFDHLDGYLSLFTPLQRRLTRKAVDMKGSEIAQYLLDLFRERLDRHNISLEASKRFSSLTVHGYPSTFYPVLVNLVDNALHWLADWRGTRRVELDEVNGGIVVRDSGPGIPDRDRDRAFELGFTRKTGGRGLGLYISRAVLAKEGYALTLMPPSTTPPWTGATFLIAPK